MLGTDSAPRAPVWTFVLLGVILLEEQGKANFFLGKKSPSENCFLGEKSPSENCFLGVICY